MQQNGGFLRYTYRQPNKWWHTHSNESEGKPRDIREYHAWMRQAEPPCAGRFL